MDTDLSGISLAEINSLDISTKPSIIRLQDGRTGVAWKATRLTFKRAGIELINKPDELIVNLIMPNSDKEGYVPGYFVITLGKFRARYQNVISSKSFERKGGYYNYSKAPQSLKEFFLRI